MIRGCEGIGGGEKFFVLLLELCLERPKGWTRFAIQDFTDISTDHIKSLEQFEAQVNPHRIVTYPEKMLFAIDPFCVHSTPLIEPPGCWRQFVKVSLSNQRYNLENNSHNYLFDYDWPLHSRDEIRNDPARAQADFIGDK